MKTTRAKRIIWMGTICSVASLFASFGNPLQEAEIWQQQEIGLFSRVYQRRFLLRESDRDYPLGFEAKKAVKIAQIYQDSKEGKLFLLLLSFISGFPAYLIGIKHGDAIELEATILENKRKSEAELKLKQQQHNLALVAKSQQYLQQLEIQEFLTEYGDPDGNPDAEVQEQLQADPFLRCFFLVQDGHSEVDAVSSTWGVTAGSEECSRLIAQYRNWQKGSEGDTGTEGVEAEVDFRSIFKKEMDTSSRRAVFTALSKGESEESIVSDVLGCCAAEAEAGKAYLKYLRQSG